MKANIAIARLLSALEDEVRRNVKDGVRAGRLSSPAHSDDGGVHDPKQVGSVRWSRGNADYEVGADGFQWEATGHYQITRGVNMKPLEGWAWPASSSAWTQPSGILFAVHPGAWSHLKVPASDEDASKPFFAGLSATIVLALDGRAVAFWAPALLHVAAGFDRFLRSPARSVEIFAVDQNDAIRLVRNPGQVAISGANGDGDFVVAVGTPRALEAMNEFLDDLRDCIALIRPDYLSSGDASFLRARQ